MRSTKTNIAEKIAVGIKLLISNILPPHGRAELVSASHSKRKDSDLRQNDVYCHAELVSASLLVGKDSDLHRNDVSYCTDVPWRVSTEIIEF